MKTAISLPDTQFEAAEQLARRLGLSRDELYRKALAEFIARHTDEGVTETLNDIYAEAQTGDMDRAMLRLQENSIPEEAWSRKGRVA